MKRSHFNFEQILFALRLAESGTSVAEVFRKMGIVEQTFYRWKKKSIGIDVAEVMRLKILVEENRRGSWSFKLSFQNFMSFFEAALIDINPQPEIIS